ncbi:methyl-accepting chemotaxis protein [Geobacter pelophilus]|uniref:Methyl-accepting chemotaxis protein n=1 Tax=Geoanaerobacter pelophilus TaxID=60036 RepID=A0AAW4L4F0_9BACT|nr:methyl-accepting chemotaxis protein [Geoanaerobacter pelophilus]MBT0662677.1 methyl-accepting chemotaxis protein [Geoanaerobacter pelophilus]
MFKFLDKAAFSKGMDGSVPEAESFEPKKVFPFASWGESLALVAEKLQKLSGTTEVEFLSIGARLHDFYARAGSIDHLSSDVAAQVGGEDIQEAIDRLVTLLNKVQEYLVDSEREAGQDCESLRKVLLLLEQVVEPLNSFGTINKVLRMLGISTKIESARLGNSAAGFDTIAADVANLSVQVLDKSQTILVQQTALSNTIRKTLEGVERIKTEQLLQVRGILDRIRANLETLKEINSNCSVIASVVANASSEISRSMSGVVTSMQFHDIVRQQIEHVETALTEVHQMLSSGEPGNIDVAVETSDICELQAAQLRQAGSEISDAVRSIIENLSSIAVKESHTAAKTRDMAGVADKAGSSFFSDMEEDLKRIAASFVSNAEANKSITTAMSSVAGTIGEIVNYVGDIEHIGEEIELIAMNAQIKAARTGDVGAALGVLAEAIQRLSVEAQEQTGNVSKTLLAVTDTTEHLFHDVGEDAAALDKEVDSIVNELDSVLRTLLYLNESIIGKVLGLESEVLSFSSDIESTTSSITVHELMVDGLADAIGCLDSIVGEVGSLIPLDLAKGKTERLKELATRYTMHSERKVHAGFTGTDLFDASTNTTDDLDDNVELF